VFQLAAGNYTLTVDGVNDATGAYSFRLLDFAAATPIALDASLTQSITPGKGSRVFSFAGAKDQVVYFDTISRAGFINSAPTWRLIDTIRERRVQRQTTTPISRNVRLPSSGTYFLLIEGVATRRPPRRR